MFIGLRVYLRGCVRVYVCKDSCVPHCAHVCGVMYSCVQHVTCMRIKHELKHELTLKPRTPMMTSPSRRVEPVGARFTCTHTYNIHSTHYITIDCTVRPCSMCRVCGCGLGVPPHSPGHRSYRVCASLESRARRSVRGIPASAFTEVSHRLRIIAHFCKFSFLAVPCRDNLCHTVN